MSIYDQGADTLYLDGASNLTTSYVGGSTFTQGGGQQRCSAWVILTWASGTTIAGSYVKLQGSYSNGSDWVDLASVNATSGDIAVEHYFPSTSNTTERYALMTQSTFLAPYLRLAGKADGTPAS